MVEITPKQRQVFYSDFLVDFDINPNTNDLVRVTNEQSVINSLKKIIKTNHFEIPYNPYFGANLYHYLFEPFTRTLELEIENEVRFAVENFEPRAEVQDIIVNARPDDNALDITLIFTTINNPTPITITTTLVRVR